MSRDSSISEGEIRSSGEEDEKANAMHVNYVPVVNKSARPRSATGSPRPTSAIPQLDGVNDEYNHHHRESRPQFRHDNSRSSYFAGNTVRGQKREPEDDHYSTKDGSDPRNFKTMYEDDRQRGSKRHRHRRPYADPNRPQPTSNDHSFEQRGRDRGRLQVKQPVDGDKTRAPYQHDRSRSPWHPGQEPRKGRPAFEDKGGMHGASDSRRKPLGSQNEEFSHSRRASTFSKGSHESPSKPLNKDAKHATESKDHSQPSNEEKEASETTDEQPPVAAVKLSDTEVAALRRKNREVIRARVKIEEEQLLMKALKQNFASAPETLLPESISRQSEQSRESSTQLLSAPRIVAQSAPSSMNSPVTPHRDSTPVSPASIDVAKDPELANKHQMNGFPHAEDQGPSAADYEPTFDMEEDQLREHNRQEHESLADSGMQNAKQGDTPVQANQSSGEVLSKDTPFANGIQPSKGFDMFADDDEFDMFAKDDRNMKPATGITHGTVLDKNLHDNWDYPDGHYRIIIGELLDNRYAVRTQLGKGTFATVVLASDIKADIDVAIKIARNNDTMTKAGNKEMDMLRLLNEADPDDKKHIIKLEGHFNHKKHLCIVFEKMSQDLREVLKKFGRHIGINIKAIRTYAQQMFLGLAHLKKCNIYHADLKPDNLLVNAQRSLLKICDLGTASFSEDAEITPYLVSRFYRAPEIILGMKYDFSIDMWSIGATLFELYTGRILFTGDNNNQMLKAIIECRGKFPIRLLKKSTFAEKHFDVDANFLSYEKDNLTGQLRIKPLIIKNPMPGNDLKARLMANSKGMPPADIKELIAFVDLLDKCLQLDPAKRVTPNDALRHEFVARPTSGQVIKPAMKVR